MGDRIIVVLPDDASDDDRRAARALGATEVLSMAEFAAREPEITVPIPTFTPAETGVLTELAYRPDTRSRLAARLGVTTSTLDNHLAAIKRKVLEHLATSGNVPLDGYLSTEALIGWVMRYFPHQET